MSDIIKARELLKLAAVQRRRAARLHSAADSNCAEALALMTRKPAVRRAYEETVTITPAIRRKVMRLAEDKSLTIADIARLVGLRNGGRVSEILNGKPKRRRNDIHIN